MKFDPRTMKDEETVKARYFITLSKDGKILYTTDASREVVLDENQMKVSDVELTIIRAVKGDLALAGVLIENLKNAIRETVQEMNQ